MKPTLIHSENGNVIPFQLKRILNTLTKKIRTLLKKFQGVFYLFTKNLITQLTFSSGGKTG